jgi:hypothetical protein
MPRVMETGGYASKVLRQAFPSFVAVAEIADSARWLAMDLGRTSDLRREAALD